MVNVIKKKPPGSHEADIYILLLQVNVPLHFTNKKPENLDF